MNAPLLTVDSLDLAFSAFESASHDLNCVSFAHGDRSDVVLGLQILTQVATHNLSSQVGGGGEVGLPGLPSLTGHAWEG